MTIVFPEQLVPNNRFRKKLPISQDPSYLALTFQQLWDHMIWVMYSLACPIANSPFIEGGQLQVAVSFSAEKE